VKIKKKLFKNIIIQHFLALIASAYILFVRLSSKIDIKNLQSPKNYWDNEESFILAFWHSQLMMVSYSWKIKKKINILASGHSDGRFGAIIGNYFNLNNVQSSNTNKSITLRPIFQFLKTKEYIGITPDGPRGPKEKVSAGIIKIARMAKKPIIPIGFWSSKNYSLKSWDSFLITLPFSKCSFVWGDPINIPETINENEIKKYQYILEQEINKCVQKAKFNCK
jgi:lysophospholipid acyltransferase (LPLAT)-like uncharacterized protein